MQMLDLLYATFTKNASDLLLKAGSPPLVRIQGELIPLAYAPLTADEVQALVFSILTRDQVEKLERDLELDIATSLSNLARFRVNVFHQHGTMALVARVVRSKIPSLDELGLPLAAKALALKPRGLVLVTGPAGCGKSTTLAALLEFRNQSLPCHIMTIEDPIEFVYEGKKALVNQREIGVDTLSYGDALRSVLRQDPDAIMVGELRDRETLAMALTAAETGHLVLSTMHTSSAVETVDRMIGIFPAHQESQVRLQISVNLAGIICQQLLARANGKGRLPAYEILLVNSAVRSLIREEKTAQLSSAIQTGSRQGMTTLNANLADLVRSGLVTLEEAMKKTETPEDLKVMVGNKPHPS
jgi:twitching motility protein PilT